MQRRSFLARSALVVSAAGAARALPQDKAMFGVGPHDLMPDFWRVYDASHGADMTARVAAIGRGFFLPNAAVFTAAGFNGGSHGRFYDNRVAAWLGQLDPIAEPVRALSGRMPAAWADHAARFRKTFPAYAGDPVYFLVSLFEFNGYSRAFGGQQLLFFGPDSIVRIERANPDLAVLFDHEAFHLYQAQVNPALGAPGLWRRLWREGLATYVSKRLNPAAPLPDVLFSVDLADASAAAIRRAAADALSGFDGDASDLDHRLFDLDGGGDGPGRLGYLVGLRAAEMIGRTRGLDQMARMPPGDVEPLLRSALAKLALENG